MTMAPRINAGHLMVMIGSAALLVSLFIDWYDPDLNAWEIFEIADIVLAGLALLALVTALPMRLPGGAGEATARLDRKLPWIGVAALVLVLVTLVNTPPAAHELDLEFGAWLGLIGAALMAVGGFLSASQVSIVIRPREADGRTRSPAADRAGRDSPAASRPLDHETEPLERRDPPPPPS